MSCRKNGDDAPIDVKSVRTDGQQAFVFKSVGSVTSAVVQVVRGKQYRAGFVWDTGGRHWGARLLVNWPEGAPRPSLMMLRENG